MGGRSSNLLVGVFYWVFHRAGAEARPARPSGPGTSCRRSKVVVAPATAVRQEDWGNAGGQVHVHGDGNQRSPQCHMRQMLSYGAVVTRWVWRQAVAQRVRDLYQQAVEPSLSP